MKFEFKRDILLINLITLIEILSVTIFTSDTLRIAVAFPFLLLCPGYALVSAVFPKKSDLDDAVERFVLSIGLSISFIPIIGLILHFTPYGIKLRPILFSVAGLVFLFSSFAIYRRRKSKEIFTYTVEIRHKGHTRREMAYGLILLVLVSLVGIATIQNITMARTEKFTEFYIFDKEGRAADYPEKLTAGENIKFILGVRNHEAEEVEYDIIIRLDGETIKTIERMRLGHKDSWEEEILLEISKVGENMKLEFLLYKNNNDEPYRTLRLFITTNE